MAASGFAANHLRSFIHRIERMEEEEAAIKADKSEIYAEAKATGFDTSVMRQVVRIRKMDKADYDEKCAVLDLYLTAMNAPPEVRIVARTILADEGAVAPAAPA